MIVSFSNLKFPENLSLGAVGGPEYSTIIQPLVSGYEQRISQWYYPKYRFNVATAIQKKEDLDFLIKFFLVHKGKAIAFRFKDWSDFSCKAQEIKPTDGIYQLYKIYEMGAMSVNRKITKPVEGTVKIYTADTTLNPEIDYEKGVFTLAAPIGENDKIFADFEFDLPARFDIDELPISSDLEYLQDIRIPIIELK